MTKTAEALREELLDIIREQLTNEQFAQFAYEFIGGSNLADQIEENYVNDTDDVTTLQAWIEQAKSFKK